MERKRLAKLTLLVGFLLFVTSPLILAQEFPTRPINITVSNNPGTNPDIIMRMLASKAEKRLGQPIVISNNGEGAGTVPLSILTKAKPDGYHLVAHTTVSVTWTIELRQSQGRPLSYTADDFTPILHYGVGRAGLVVKTESPFKTLKELVEYARQNPEKVSYSVSAFGNPPHFAMEYIAHREGIKMICIPCGGDGAALTALLGGHVTACSSPQNWISQVKEGKFRLLVVYTTDRMRIFPDAPALRELGYDYTDDPFYMLSAPRGTPPSIVNKLDDAFHKAMGDPEFIQFMEKINIEIVYRNSEELKSFIKKTGEFWKKQIAEIGITKAPDKK